MCIHIGWQCDKDVDCPSGEDEQDCRKFLIAGNFYFNVCRDSPIHDNCIYVLLFSSHNLILHGISGEF